MPKQFLDEEGLAIVATKVNEKLKVVDAMPSTPTSGQVVLYVGATTTNYTQGGIYLYSGTAWVLISTADVDLTPYKKIFTGTKAEWELLTTAEKKEYDEADLTDDLAGGELVVSDSVTLGDLNPVTSNAVAKLTGPIADISALVSGNVINVDVIRTTCGTGLYALKCETATTIFTAYLAVWSGNWSLDYTYGTSSQQTASIVSTVTVTEATNIANIVKLG